MTLTKEQKTGLAKINKEIGGIKIFGTIDKGAINNFTPPYSVRNNCQVGQWSLGDDNFIGSELELSIFAIKHFYGDLGKTEKTQWLQVWFIAAPKEEKLPENTVCVTYLKTRSQQALSQKFIEVMGTIDPGLVLWKTSFEKHQGDMGAYYSVNFEPRIREESEVKQIKMLAEFLHTSPLLVDSNLPPTMIELEEPNDPIALSEAHKQLKELMATD